MSYSLIKTSKALGDETRLSIYRYLETTPDIPASIRGLTEHFRLHPNAIRQHLAKLEEAGLIFSESNRTAGSGRPQRVYRVKGPVHGTDLLPRDYKLLCEMLLEIIASSKMSAIEVKAFGRRWGEKRVRALAVDGEDQRSPQDAARILVSQLSAWGFEPSLTSSSEQQIDIRLHNCIFQEAAEFHPELVCPLLHGVLEGLLIPFVGEHRSDLEHGIAKGEASCRVLVTLK